MLHTTKSDLIRKAVIYYRDALEKEKLKEQTKNPVTCKLS